MWRSVTLLGACLILMGLTAFYLDVAVDFKSEVIQHHYDGFGSCILLGVLAAFVGCIAWARSSSRKHKTIMAASVFVAPLLALLIGSPVDGINVHGPSAITIMLMLPASVLAVVLVIMAAFGSKARQ